MPTKPDYIYLESSALLALNTDLKDLKFQNFLQYTRALEVPLFTTALCVDEFVAERIERLRETLSDFQESMEDVGRFLGQRPEVRPLGSADDLAEQIRAVFRHGLEEAEVEIIENASLSLPELLHRATRHVQPFEPKDKGFKDTIILLTILGDASRRGARTAMLIVTDGDFHTQEIRDQARAAGMELVVVRTIDDAVAHLKQVLAEDTRRRIDEEIANLKAFLLGEEESILRAIRQERFNEWDLTRGTGVFRIHEVLDSRLNEIESVIPEALLEEASTGRIALEFVAKLRVLVLGEPLRLPIPASGTLSLEAGAQPEAGTALFGAFLARTPDVQQFTLEPRFYLAGSAHYDADRQQYSDLEIDLVRPSGFAAAIARRLRSQGR